MINTEKQKAITVTSPRASRFNKKSVVKYTRKSDILAPPLPLSKLENVLNYKFKEKKNLQLALIHRSFASESNERLEFLGDAVLNLIISDYLHTKYQDAQEGLLSRVRAKLVGKKTLQNVARSKEIMKYIRVGEAEKKNIHSYHTSVASDALEAIIGAIYLDGGIRQARSAIMRLFKTELNLIDINKLYKDYKTRLQELIQSNYHSVPDYELKRQEILAQNVREFWVACTIPNHEGSFIGKGSNRKEAEQNAARQALEALSNKLID